MMEIEYWAISNLFKKKQKNAKCKQYVLCKKPYQDTATETHTFDAYSSMKVNN